MNILLLVACRALCGSSSAWQECGNNVAHLSLRLKVLVPPTRNSFGLGLSAGNITTLLFLEFRFPLPAWEMELLLLVV
jgi:hypothetical protein